MVTRQRNHPDDRLAQLVQDVLAEVEMAITAALRAVQASAPSRLPPMTFTTAQVAEAIPMPVESVRRAIKAGELVAVPAGRGYVMTLTDICDFAIKRYQHQLMDRLMRIATGGC